MDREISSEQAKVHPYRHMVTRALGAGPESILTYRPTPAETGDRMLICSDGLTGEVDDVAIEQMLRSPADVRTVCGDLVSRALDAGGHDNVSVVVVEAVEAVGHGLPRASRMAPPSPSASARGRRGHAPAREHRQPGTGLMSEASDGDSTTLLGSGTWTTVSRCS